MPVRGRARTEVRDTPHPPTPLRDARHRGSVYLLVLGVSSIVLVIGMSAIAAVRIQHRGSTDQAHTAQAQALADAGLQIALQRLAADPGWRTSGAYTHDTWTAAEALADGSFAFKLIDLTDTNLADDKFDPFRILVRTTRAQAVRLVGVEVEVIDPLGPELLSNGGFETSTTAGWSASPSGGADLDIVNSDVHSLAYALRVKNRNHRSYGPVQDLMGEVFDKRTYRIQAWVKMKDNAEGVRIGFVLGNLLILNDYQAITGSVGTGWTLVAGDVTVNMLLNLLKLDFFIDTASSDQEFWADQVSVREVLVENPYRVVRGSYRRELDQ